MTQKLHPYRLTGKQRALLAGGEASLWLRVQARVLATPADRQEIAELARLRNAMPHARQLPDYFAWDELAADMRANILVALEAGDVVRPRRIPISISWRAGFAMAALSLLMVAGYWWRMPHPFSPAPPVNGVVLEASASALGLGQSESGFSVVVDSASARPLVQGAQGGMRADYVDTQTGQLTVAHVYAE